MGHPASEAMCLALKQRFYWRTMEADCRTCVKYCDACQRWRDKKLPLGRLGETQYYEESGQLFHTILVDCLGPYGGSGKKIKKHPDAPTPAATEGLDKANQAVVIMDEFTRFCKIYPQTRITSETICDCLTQWSDSYDIPEVIKSDTRKGGG